MTYIGIDPGARGAVAVLIADNLAVHDMPVVVVRVGNRDLPRICAASLAALMARIKPGTAWIEAVSAMPKQGVASTFQFGRALGLAEAATAAAGHSITLITPPTWRRAAQVPAGKDGSRLRAAQLFPAYAHLFARAKDDGRAEAALMAWGAARQ